MHISARGLRLIESFEGWSSAPYFDSYGGVWTRGFGETEGIGPDSPHISRAEGEARLRHLIETRYEWAIDDLHLPLNQNQFDALCSFVWNLGAGIFTGSLRDALLRHDWRAAANQMLAYDHAGGVVLEGLARRRREEVALFLAPAGPVNALDVLDPAERRLANTLLLYRQHPRLHAHGIRVVRAALVRKRKEVWLAAVKGLLPDGRHVAPGWEVHDRSARYRLLVSLTR